MFTIRNKGWYFPTQSHVIRWTQSEDHTHSTTQIQISTKAAILIETPKTVNENSDSYQKKRNLGGQIYTQLNFTQIKREEKEREAEEEAKMKILCRRNKKGFVFLRDFVNSSSLAVKENVKTFVYTRVCEVAAG